MKSEDSFFNSPFYRKLIEDTGNVGYAWEVSYCLGGLRVYIPQIIKRDNFIYKALKGNMAIIEYLENNYHGLQVIIPLGPTSDFRKRSKQAQILAMQGKSTNYIIQQLGLSYRAVQYNKSKVKKQLVSEMQNSFAF